MNRKIISILITALTFAFAPAAEPQEARKVYRIGFLAFGSPPPSEALSPFAGFRRGLRDLGYIESRNILLDFVTPTEIMIGCPAWRRI